MIGNNSAKPAILVDLKKYRIRISKKTLRSLGDPNHVLLLVNPKERTLAILRSDRSDLRAQFVAAASAKNNKSIEMYSRSLIKSLCSVCGKWHENQSYRLYGEIIPDEGMARFDLLKAILINGDESQRHD